MYRETFETGDRRNWAPLYLGAETDWVRPSLTVSDSAPISGQYSLSWEATANPHEWAIVSNAFPVRQVTELRAKVRIDGGTERIAAGVGIAESADRSTLLTLTESGLELRVERWNGPPEVVAEFTPDRGVVYELRLVFEDGVTGSVRESNRDDVLATLEADSAVRSNAIALYVEIAAGGSSRLTFDDIQIKGGDRSIRSGEWIRAPKFVAVPREPIVTEDQGNWVGAHSVLRDDDRYRMWYRIRTNEVRGTGYGYAESQNGLQWETESPVFVPEGNWESVEGICVRKIADRYRAWYALDDGETWYVATATSPDGFAWEDHGRVIEGYCKDPIVVHVVDTYYLYAIAPTKNQVSVFTSDNGREWEHQNILHEGTHSHPGAYFARDTERVWLYLFGETGSDSPVNRVRRASSANGIEFGEFEVTWTDPPVGLDRSRLGGIDYGAFPVTGPGHLPAEGRVPMYYQARHEYRNNRPGWRWAEDGQIVLAGRFEGLFEGVETTVTECGYTYAEFPMEAAPIGDVSCSTGGRTTVLLERGRAGTFIGEIAAETACVVTVSVSGRLAENETEFLADGEAIQPAEPSDDGLDFDIELSAGESVPVEIR